MSRKERFAKLYMFDETSHYIDFSKQRKAQLKLEDVIINKQTAGELKPSEGMHLLLDYVKDRLIADAYYSVPLPLFDVCSEPRCMNPPIPPHDAISCTKSNADVIVHDAALGGHQFFRIIDARPETKYALHVGHVHKPSHNSSGYARGQKL